ncbi:S-adenosyl-L-methionine-dependent methyltransferase [Thozetella sp. PMI_491]|nr:S-adenosyl-L-methionine-dependent methyltransferase [Thozetella sp. PMI_491]
MPPKRNPPAGRPPHSERAVALHSHIFSLPAEELQGQPWKLCRTIEDFANNEGLGMIYRQKKMEISRRALTGLDPKPKLILEFGTFVGVSAIGWAATLKELNPGADDVHLYTFELDPKMAQIARDLIKLAGLEDVVTIVVGPAAESLKQLHADGKVSPGKVDMAFIDHWEEHYKPDLQLCEQLKLFHVGSIVIADNTDMPGAPDYLEYVKKGGSGESGAVKYQSESYLTDPEERGPKVVEISTIIAV